MDFHIETHGSGSPVLFLHAGVADSRMWRDQLGLSGYQTVAFDFRGFGKTLWEPGEFRDRDDALAVLDHLGIEKATVVGCSMGGGTALELAIENPERVAALVLVGATAGGWVPDDGWEDHPLWEEAAEASKAGNLERVAEIDLEMWLVGYGRSGDEIDPEVKELFLDMDRTPLATESERHEHVRPYHKKHNDHLDEIDVPTLVVVGAHDEPFLLKAADYLAGKLSDQPAVVIDDAAHLPSLEQPDAFNEALLGFLDSH